MTPDEKQAHEEKHERSGRAVGGWVVDDRQSGWATGVGTETLLKHVYKTLCTAQARRQPNSGANTHDTCTYETGRGLEWRLTAKTETRYETYPRTTSRTSTILGGTKPTAVLV